MSRLFRFVYGCISGLQVQQIFTRDSLAEETMSIYLSFFFIRSWLLLPHFFLRQLLALGGKRA